MMRKPGLHIRRPLKKSGRLPATRFVSTRRQTCPESFHEFTLRHGIVKDRREFNLSAPGDHRASLDFCRRHTDALPLGGEFNGT